MATEIAIGAATLAAMAVIDLYLVYRFRKAKWM